VLDLSHESDFLSIGGDSGSVVRLHRLIRKTFQVTFPLLHLFEFSTLGAMSAKIQEECAQAARSIQWDTETAIDSANIATRAAQLFESESTEPTSRSSRRKAVVLTGATSNLAGVLLPTVAKHEEIGEIHCVAIRDMKKAETIIQAAGLSSQQRSKVHLYAGDLTLPRLGLAEDDFARLMKTADSIVHLAAARAFWDDYYVLRANNVTSVRELLLLAAPRKIPIHFMSSGGVTQYTGAPTTPQQCPPTDGSDGYVSGKWVVEQMLKSAAGQLEFPVNIYRTLPAETVDGDGVGRPEVLDAFVRHAKNIAAVPADSAASWDGHVDLLKLSAIAKDITQAIMASMVEVGSDPTSRQASTYVKVINYGSQTRVTLEQVLSRLGTETVEEQVEFERLEVLEWMGRLKRAGFPYMLASLSLTYKSSEQSKPLVLKR
jgi:hybrid polyketide synthase/nonribosomal peptide synthetase ACE1